VPQSRRRQASLPRQPCPVAGFGPETRAHPLARQQICKNELGSGENRRNLAVNELDAKAILPELRSVQKANSYQ